MIAKGCTPKSHTVPCPSSITMILSRQGPWLLGAPTKHRIHSAFFSQLEGNLKIIRDPCLSYISASSKEHSAHQRVSALSVVE